MIEALVGLGSNMGGRRAHLARALEHLDSTRKTRLIALSSLFETDPVGDPGLSRFLNAVAVVETGLASLELLDRLQAVEADAGRPRWARAGARTLDLDLLAYGDRVESGSRLVLPHPGLAFRPFVLIPLAQVRPGWIHPRLDTPVEGLLRAYPDVSGVRFAGNLDLPRAAVAV